ncbi:CUN068 hypothetical protein [Culex nigripalpus nucleopolyhedrovirus]|uniref:Uncharacterized protein n=1 Tax=Culex nigripalpus nucleopolyhedrovirus (isolate Florida/1997) TaxID=645993 RepID=Q919K8_NPVCO|nr:CUN068 hypothetical protein [Culex nigripalpus nucleopolyhedrovirus]AAK94146.1 CUN068 hypothetical protein [Culex nigripalpus nucleopolyhedrovirus]
MSCLLATCHKPCICSPTVQSIESCDAELKIAQAWELHDGTFVLLERRDDSSVDTSYIGAPSSRLTVVQTEAVLKKLNVLDWSWAQIVLLDNPVKYPQYSRPTIYFNYVKMRNCTLYGGHVRTLGDPVLYLENCSGEEVRALHSSLSSRRYCVGFAILTTTGELRWCVSDQSLVKLFKTVDTTAGYCPKMYISYTTKRILWHLWNSSSEFALQRLGGSHVAALCLRECSDQGIVRAIKGSKQF